MTGQQDHVRLDRFGDVALITIMAPPVNALGHAVRVALGSALDAANSTRDLQAIIICAEGDFFSAGADIRELSAAPRAPLLVDICRQIEEAPIPVTVVMKGAALGGGAELVLAAHYRLAGPDATIALPEVRLGLVPGAGGTQRLPRLIGARAALLLMTSGQKMDATAAADIGLIDAIIPDPTQAAAIAFAQGLITEGLGPRPTLAVKDYASRGGAWLAAVAEARAAKPASPLLARRRIIDCVEAALLLPPDAGLAFERTAFLECLASPESAALRYLFLAERRLPGLLGSRGPDNTVTLGLKGKSVAARLDRALGTAASALLRAGSAQDLVKQALVRLGLDGQDKPLENNQRASSPDVVASIERALVAAVMAEGGRLMAEGEVSRATDVDVIAVAGAGWPRLSGGPMHTAVREGLARLLTEMETLVGLDPVWIAPGILRDAVKYAFSFDALDGTDDPRAVSRA